MFFALAAATLGCDSPIQREGRLYPTTTVGKRLNEAVRQNINSSACEPQARAFLDQKQTDLVQNVDFLFSRFEPSAPDADLLDKRIKWVADTDLEPLAKQLANLIETRKLDLQDSLTALFGDTLVALPTREQIWKSVLFLQKEDLKTLESNLNASLAKWGDPRNKESKEVASILNRIVPVITSAEGRLIADTFFAEGIKGLPSEAQIWSLIELISREELHSLLPLARSASKEFLRPTREETNEVKAIFERLQIVAKSAEARFLQQTLLGDNFLDRLDANHVYLGIELARRPDIRSLLPKARTAMLELSRPQRQDTVELLAIFDRLKMATPGTFKVIPTETQFLNLLPLIHRLEIKDLLFAPEIEEALTITKRLNAFTKTEEGITLIKLTKAFITDERTQKAVLDLSEVLETKDRFSRTNEKFGIGLLLGDYYGASLVRSACALLVSSWYKIDRDILDELLDFGVVLYREGVIDDLLRLEELVLELAEKRPLNAQLMQQIATELGLKLDRPHRSELEAFLRDKENQKYLVSTIESSLEQNTIGDVIRAIQITQSLMQEHKFDFENLGLLLNDGLGHVSKPEHKELAQKIYKLLRHFAANPNSIFLNPQIQKDVARLNEIAFDIETSNQTDLALLQKLADEYDFSLDKISKDRIEYILSFLRDEKYQKAFDALIMIGARDGLIEDVFRLDELSQKFLAENSGNFELIRKLAGEVGIQIGIPPREDIGRFLTFVSNPKMQEAAKTLLEISLEFAMLSIKAQKQFASFPMPNRNNSNRSSIFQTFDKVSEEDFSAAWNLITLGFDLWSMSPENQCKPKQKTHLTPQDIAGTLSQISTFLTTPENGLKSWLTLMRRAANDTKS